MMKHWTTEQDANGVVLARFTNGAMNYFCADAAAELVTLIADWHRADVRAVVLTGTVPGKFITHYSVEELVELSADHPRMDALGTGLSDGYHDMLRSLQDLPKPVIAAINGDCMGGGFELSLWCDVRVMATGDHRIGLPEVLLGILPGGSGTQMLPGLVGAAKAREMILRGTISRPEQALALGLVHELAADAAVRGVEIATAMVRSGATALAMAKGCMHPNNNPSLAAGLSREAANFLATMRSAAGLHTMQAYLAVAPAGRRDWLEAQAAS